MDDLFYTRMIVEHGLTPEQVDSLPIGVVNLIPIVSAIFNQPTEVPRAQ
jgi:hypothetical protein